MPQVEHGTKHDLVQLERAIKGLHDAQRDYADPQPTAELIHIIKQPWWTTPAEFALVLASIEQLTQLTRALQDMQRAVVNGARLVGADEAGRAVAE